MLKWIRKILKLLLCCFPPIIFIADKILGIPGHIDDWNTWKRWIEELSMMDSNWILASLFLLGLAMWLIEKYRTVPFDMSVRDAVNHIMMILPYSPAIPSQPNLRKQTALEALYHYICNGDIPIWGSLDGLAPPTRISTRKCRNLTPRIKHVPQNSASPESIGFSLFGLPKSGNEDDPFVEYSNLWICSSDLYRIWPKKP